MRATRWIPGLAVVALLAWGAWRAVGLYDWLGRWTDCSNVILSEAVSSDGKRAATVFERNCGATTSFARFVSVRLAAAAFDPQAEKEYVLVVEGQPDIKVAWDAPDYLSVKFGATPRIVRQVLIWYGVTVSYD
jgi:hypothetical protein